MEARTLITTSDENTWDKEGPIVFLGEWCKRFSRKSEWEKLDSITLPYHWDDGSKFKDDYHYLDKIYEEMLIDFSNHLNNFHNVNHSTRYWRILIGSWLGVFIQVLYDRWVMLNYASKNYEIKECIVLDKNFDSVVPKNAQEFSAMVTGDYWNEAIYAELIDRCFNETIPTKKVKIEKQKSDKKLKSNGVNKSQVIRIIKTLFEKILPSTNDQFFLKDTYLPLIHEIKLQIKLKQIPKIWSTINLNFTKKINIKSRQWNKKSNLDEFSKLAYQMAILHIPTSYLENYEDLVDSVPTSWPKKPKIIFTSVSWFLDEVFKLWSAKKCEEGSLLFIGQHGGHFGMTDISFLEKHQIDISDKWVSWGWSEPAEPKIIQGFNFKEKNLEIKPNYKGLGLLATTTHPRYSARMIRATVAGQWKVYLQENQDFFGLLSSDIQNKMLIRTTHNAYGWDENDAWKDFSPSINFGNYALKIHEEMKSCRVLISTYNATTYLESLFYNFPTIIFWNEEHWDLKTEVKEYFDLLESVGIFHKSPSSAAKKLEEVWDNIPEWWDSKEVQNARNIFCKNFSHKVSRPVEHFQVILQNETISLR
jgi:putative transferase (TIGR04331 family)